MAQDTVCSWEVCSAFLQHGVVIYKVYSWGWNSSCKTNKLKQPPTYKVSKYFKLVYDFVFDLVQSTGHELQRPSIILLTLKKSQSKKITYFLNKNSNNMETCKTGWIPPLSLFVITSPFFQGEKLLVIAWLPYDKMDCLPG